MNDDYEETPPRVWGRLRSCWISRRRLGNTPTCVGKTELCRYLNKITEKHPHVCGEDRGSFMSVKVASETPPRVWGRQFKLCIRRGVTGNTPTCVGKTASDSTIKARLEKHPHVCGEDQRNLTRIKCRWETPPRVWGRLRLVNRATWHTRNTPTCVGKTRINRHCTRCTRKHPHVCGEDFGNGRHQSLHGETHPHVCGEDA